MAIHTLVDFDVLISLVILVALITHQNLTLSLLIIRPLNGHHMSSGGANTNITGMVNGFSHKDKLW
jgi:hypothetical protein